MTLSLDGRRLASADKYGEIREWDLSKFSVDAPELTSLKASAEAANNQVQYTNAKVLLVGETGVGKTGLSKVLAGERWEATDSTIGAWATQWKLPTTTHGNIEREIWLWDFGGQADQRLIHQLYMDDAALAVLIFDGQKEDTFETLGQWDRDLARASTRDFSKFLVAGRTDVGSLRVSRSQMQDFVKERGFSGYLETSAKTGAGCEDLKRAITEPVP